MLKYEPNKDNSNRNAKASGREITRPQQYTINCSQIRNAKSKRNHFPYGAEYKWVIQYQIVSHTLHTGGAVHSEQVILSNMNVYTYMNVMTMKDRAMNLILSAGLVLRAKVRL